MHGEYKMPGGKLVVVDLEVQGGRLAEVQVSGDFFLEPDSALNRINEALNEAPVTSNITELANAITTQMGANVSMYGVSPEAIAIAVRRALDAG